jgi:hypothetical protein
MQTVNEIRRQNLELLVQQHSTLEEVARLGSTSAVYLSQLRNGAIDQKTGKPRQMGSAMARRLETSCGKAPGWMDTPHIAPESSLAHPAGSTYFPVAGSVRVDREEFIVDEQHAGGFVRDVGTRDGYAVLIRGDSPARSLRDGQYMVIEFDGDPAYSDYAILRTKDGARMVEIRARRDSDRYLAEVVYSGDRLILTGAELKGLDCVVAVVSANRFTQEREPSSK